MMYGRKSDPKKIKQIEKEKRVKKKEVLTDYAKGWMDACKKMNDMIQKKIKDNK